MRQAFEWAHPRKTLTWFGLIGQQEEENQFGETKMLRIFAAFAIIGVLALGGCSRLGGERSLSGNPGGLIGRATDDTSLAQNTRSGDKAAEVTQISDFLDAKSLSGLTPKDRAEASSAQYYALQFGRPGAPRSWQGDSGASGLVSVGPYVRVNSLDCRDFVHKVTVTGQTHQNKGTACREPNGDWDIVD